MAGYSMYNTYVLHWSKALTSLDAILTKAEAHAKENDTDADVQYFNAKLSDDMYTLPHQVRLCIGIINAPLGLLTGSAPEWPGDEKTFADLHARIKTAQEYLQSVKPEDVDGREDEILKPIGRLSDHYPNGLSAKEMCECFTTSNVYFHLVIVYGILRKEGVPLGKIDFLNPFLPSPL